MPIGTSDPQGNGIKRSTLGAGPKDEIDLEALFSTLFGGVGFLV